MTVSPLKNGHVQCFELTPARGRLSSGWVLITALLEHQGATLQGTLVTETKAGERRFSPLPITLKGRLHELARLPAGVRSAWVELASSLPVQCKVPFQVQPIGTLASRYVIYRRIVHTPASQRRALGITMGMQLFRPYRAYRLAANTRYYMASPTYAEWIALYERFTPADLSRLQRAVKGPRLREVAFEVVIDAWEHADANAIANSLRSLERQHAFSCRACILVDDNGAATLPPSLQERAPVVNMAGLEARLAAAGHTWVFTLQPGTELAPWALAWMAVEAAKEETQLIYSDHDYLLAGQRQDPVFKPDWSEELARASGYVGTAFALRSELLLKVLRQSGFASAYQLMLDAAALAGAGGVCHIPAVLCHHARPLQPVRPQRHTLEQHLSRQGVTAGVEAVGDYLRVRYPLPAPLPRVSIVVPTRDALNYLQTCVESVLEKTTWPHYELLIVDNQSSDPATLAYFDQVSQDERIRVVPYDQPFNFSAINNFAVQQARGEVICLLNNDTEVISPNWLEEMVSRLLQPGVGVVGARLYFGDGRVQHAGDVLGPGGCASHLHGILEGDDPGYMHRAVLAQDLSAVTAACFVTRRALFEQLGGLDADHLSVAFNDVDYCLRVREAGWRVIYTPYAELYHHESVSRGKDDSPEKQARAKSEADYMRARWGHVIERDPFYNPNLNYSQPDFKLGKIPRVGWPW
ncbi:glycosyltransferase family 2 protein [Zobellella iuensis]|uniref:glycosyltransferase family 2 protein n=1 Tax=Zobellella iuensis TaxID=2803811 RepID=UPI00192273D6